MLSFSNKNTALKLQQSVGDKRPFCFWIKVLFSSATQNLFFSHIAPLLPTFLPRTTQFHPRVLRRNFARTWQKKCCIHALFYLRITQNSAAYLRFFPAERVRIGSTWKVRTNYIGGEKVGSNGACSVFVAMFYRISRHVVESCKRYRWFHPIQTPEPGKKKTARARAVLGSSQKTENKAR